MKNVHLLGIGGIGMSALARYYSAHGLKVSGYDRMPSFLTRRLAEEGVAIHYQDRPDLLPRDVGETRVIYSSAIPEDLGELMQARRDGYQVMKRAQSLGRIADGMRCVAIAGTHGKTTTSTMVAHILAASGENCTAFLGGISKNFDSNILLGSSGTLVVEADEYDRSFLVLHPEMAVITSIDADHLDKYGDYAHVVNAFKSFARQVTGTLIVKKGVPISAGDTAARIFTYHPDDPDADFRSGNIRLGAKGCYLFDLEYPDGIIRDIQIGVPGKINVENAIAAAAVALLRGIPADFVRKAIASFKGVKRRLDIHVDSPSVAYVDDYAHHPAELSAALSSLREIFPVRKITAIFQPHLYSRTRDLAVEFGQALSRADKLILLDIYPAREEPIPGISSELILKYVSCRDKEIIRKDDLLPLLSNEGFDVLVTFGAGDVGQYVERIAEIARNRIEGI